MSILIVEILPHGIVFAADRFVTVTRHRKKAGSTLRSRAQDTASKILKWPHNRALIGAVGRTSIGDRSLYDWLYDFIGDHVAFTDPSTVAQDLRDRLQGTLGQINPPAATIVEFTTFAKHNGIIVPEMWHITNVPGVDQNGYLPATNQFMAAEQILGVHLKAVEPKDLQGVLAECSGKHAPFWFHQGIDLAIFNMLEEGVKQAFRALHKAGKLRQPQTLEDWERHAKMWVLIYGAYFEAFGEAGERYVGGGADVLSIPWPNVM
jgi:hypothetical protein